MDSEIDGIPVDSIDSLVSIEARLNEASFPKSEDPLSNQSKCCAKCKVFLSLENIAKIDPKFCSSCFHDVSVEDTTYVRTEEEYDVIRDTLKRHEQKCRQLKFGGADYVWYTRTFATLSEAEAKASIEYHRSCVALLESEILSKKIKQVQVHLNSGDSATYTRKVTITKTTTRTGKTKKPVVDNFTALLQALMATGMPEAQARAMVIVAQGAQSQPQNPQAKVEEK